MSDVTKLSDVDVWVELTLTEIDMFASDSAPKQAHFTDDLLMAEIDRRWGSDALERVAEVITGGKFSPDDELRWLAADPTSFMKIVTGEVTPKIFFDVTD